MGAMSSGDGFSSLQSLLLFQALADHSPGPEAFSAVSDVLKKSSLFLQGCTPDDARVEPQSLKNLYVRLVKQQTPSSSNGPETTSAGETHVAAKSQSLQDVRHDKDLVSQMVPTLYEDYRDKIIREVRDEERRYDALVKEVKALRASLENKRDGRLVSEDVADHTGQDSGHTMNDASTGATRQGSETIAASGAEPSSVARANSSAESHSPPKQSHTSIDSIINHDEPESAIPPHASSGATASSSRSILRDSSAASPIPPSQSPDQTETQQSVVYRPSSGTGPNVRAPASPSITPQVPYVPSHSQTPPGSLAPQSSVRQPPLPPPNAWPYAPDNSQNSVLKPSSAVGSLNVDSSYPSAPDAYVAPPPYDRPTYEQQLQQQQQLPIPSQHYSQQPHQVPIQAPSQRFVPYSTSDQQIVPGSGSHRHAAAAAAAAAAAGKEVAPAQHQAHPQHMDSSSDIKAQAEALPSRPAPQPQRTTREEPRALLSSTPAGRRAGMKISIPERTPLDKGSAASFAALQKPGVTFSPGSQTGWKAVVTPSVTHEKPRPRSVSPISDQELDGPRTTQSQRSRKKSFKAADAEIGAATSSAGRRRGLQKAHLERERDRPSASASEARGTSQSTTSHRGDTPLLGAERLVKDEPGTPVVGTDNDENESAFTPTVGTAKFAGRGGPSKRKRDISLASSFQDDSTQARTPLAAPPAYPPNMVLASRNFARMADPLMNNIASHKHASIFANPVKERDAEGYFDIIKRPQDLKSIRAAIASGSRAVAAAVAENAAQASPGPPGTPLAGTASGTMLLPVTDALVPPKGIVNAEQLECEVMRMFANAVLFNPGDEDIVQETREMYEAVEGQLSSWRAAERMDEGAGGGGGGPEAASAGLEEDASVGTSAKRRRL